MWLGSRVDNRLKSRLLDQVMGSDRAYWVVTKLDLSSKHREPNGGDDSSLGQVRACTTWERVTDCYLHWKELESGHFGLVWRM